MACRSSGQCGVRPGARSAGQARRPLLVPRALDEGAREAHILDFGYQAKSLGVGRAMQGASVGTDEAPQTRIAAGKPEGDRHVLLFLRYAESQLGAQLPAVS